MFKKLFEKIKFYLMKKEMKEFMKNCKKESQNLNGEMCTIK